MGIRGKLILPLIAMLVIMLAGLDLFLKPRWITQEYELFLGHQQELLKTIGTSIAADIALDDYSALYEVMNKSVASNAGYWKQIDVLREDGEKIYSHSNDSKASFIESGKDISHVITFNEKPVGLMRLSADWSSGQRRISERISDIEILLTAGFCVLMISALSIQSALIRVPLEKMQYAVSAISRGDYSVKLPDFGNDEIGKLGSAFGLMRQCIIHNEAALKNAVNEAEIAEHLLQQNQEALLAEHVALSKSLDETRVINQQLKQTQNELEHLKNALDVHAIVSITGVGGDITFVNDKFCEVSGYRREELIGKNHRLLRSGVHSHEYYKKLWETISRGNVWQGELCNQAKDGSLYWVEASIVPFLNDKGRPYKYVSIRTNITERVLAAQRLKSKTEEINRVHADLKKTHQQALHSEKLASVGQLAAGIAHEINTPIQFIGDNTRFLRDSFDDLNTLIKTYQELCAALKSGEACEERIMRVHELSERVEIDYLSEEVPRAIEQTLEGVERVSKIVLSMKDFSHPGSDSKEMVDINHAIQSTVTVSRNEWKYDAELVTDFDDTLPLVPCYIGELNQVILNIIINASHAIKDIKASHGDQPGTIKISTSRRDDFVEIRISDTGAGMTESVKNRIFEPFFTTKSVGKGSGQGLAIAYSVIVEKHHGTIDVDSAPGEGATFIIRLPLNTEIQKMATNASGVDALKIVQGGHA